LTFLGVKSFSSLPAQCRFKFIRVFLCSLNCWVYWIISYAYVLFCLLMKQRW